jgi:two-component system uhpT operon response regulator UhpA
MSPIKVIIIDDNKAIRALIREILEFEDGIEICDEAENLTRAREVLSQWQPDIAILDISLGQDEGGLEFLKDISRPAVATNFIIVSNHEEEHYSAKSLKVGAKGYVCKSRAVQCLADAIRAVHAGKEFVSSERT